MAADNTNDDMTAVSAVEQDRMPSEYLEHEDFQKESVVSEDVTTDYITGREVKVSVKERFRQRIAHALFHEYGLSVEDMEPDFPIPVEVGGKTRRKKIAIAIFTYRSPDSFVEQEERERIRLNGKNQYATLRRKVPIVDDDLSGIAKVHHKFRKKYPEPGR